MVLRVDTGPVIWATRQNCTNWLWNHRKVLLLNHHNHRTILHYLLLPRNLICCFLRNRRIIWIYLYLLHHISRILVLGIICIFLNLIIFIYLGRIIWYFWILCIILDIFPLLLYNLYNLLLLASQIFFLILFYHHILRNFHVF